MEEKENRNFVTFDHLGLLHALFQSRKVLIRSIVCELSAYHSSVVK